MAQLDLRNKESAKFYPQFTVVLTANVHCKYIRSNYDGITVYHCTSTIFRCNVPLHLNIPIAKVRYPKIYSDMIVKCQ